jgi:hypothetical protein
VENCDCWWSSSFIVCMVHRDAMVRRNLALDIPDGRRFETRGRLVSVTTPRENREGLDDTVASKTVAPSRSSISTPRRLGSFTFTSMRLTGRYVENQLGQPRGWIRTSTVSADPPI